ncbi:MAG: hypothetical protein KatS3mg090_0762 [Patescibacteria group bacterium]|nr:MAG: hypothetical protein KatS3mg090_0762 [Patescibacteria group bacterium]
MPRSTTQLAKWFFRPSLIWDDFDEDFGDLTMTEGVDMFEENNKIFVKAAVPGIDPNNVDITFEDGVLHIKAKEEKKEEDKNERQYYRKDRIVSFDYTVTVPRPVNPDSLTAEVKDGVVTVSADLADTAKSRKIPVKKA